MKLKFDANQDYQNQAVQAVIGLFEGQEKNDSFFEYSIREDALNLVAGVANKCVLSQSQILENLQRVESLQNLPQSLELQGMNFSVEMETGTGKTYVYLRTIYELNKIYGFKKFVIVVPSLAIREGVLKNLEITHDHFQTLYEDVPIRFSVYDSAKVSSLRSFACGNNIEILVMNIDSFAKDENVINRANDRLTGQRPIEFIQSVNPIVIIDEPQNIETEKRKTAVESLNPLCTLRYSATHKQAYNLIYSLNPVRAYDLGLVKQIEVDSVVTQNSFNQAFIWLEKIVAAKTKLSAKIKIDINTPKEVKRKLVSIEIGDDLYVLSQERQMYRDGYILKEIDALNGSISFSNGVVLYQGQGFGDYSQELMQVQVRKTIEEHLKKSQKLRPLGIKVLSLFFIDRVSNYRTYVSGKAAKGKLAESFEKIYTEVTGKQAQHVHNGYFSQDRKGVLKDTNGNTLADDEIYELIMKDKEKLLSLDNPLEFIFSHSALREGWDNPNVFQICTLNETKSELKKRQEIGRGLRLCVNDKGERIFDKNINRLTVIANESYEDFAKSLQQEIEEDCGVSFSGRIKNAQEKRNIRYRKGFELDDKFKEIWDKIKYKTSYRVEYDSSLLVDSAAKNIREMPEIKRPQIVSIKKQLVLNESGVDAHLLSASAVEESGSFNVPDILDYVQSRTYLTRSSILKIFKQSGRLADVLVNPQLFLDLSLAAIQTALNAIMVDGIRYFKLGNKEYEMRLFDDSDLHVFLDGKFFEVSNQAKTIYENYVPIDSEIENQFAKDCQSSQDVEFYFKLPRWFEIATPLGSYNPDWALILKGQKKIYFVVETKASLNSDQLRPLETLKMKCGKKHFALNVEYRAVAKLSDLRV